MRPFNWLSTKMLRTQISFSRVFHQMKSKRDISSGLTKMKPSITRMSIYQIDLPFKEGSFKFSNGKSVDEVDATVVRIETDIGLDGWGEVSPLGSSYLPAYPEGARVGMRELGSHLMGEDPTELLKINQLMDRAMKGHSYVKSAIDIACWDIFGKYAGLPVCSLLGGRFGDAYPLYRAISQDTPREMAEALCRYREEGYKTFQVKVGGDPADDIERMKLAASVLKRGEVLIADANTGWQMHEAVNVIRAVKDLPVPLYIEQPCPTYEECLSVRRMCPIPFILDESIDSIGMVMRMFRDNAADAINLKISKVGGLTKARQIRDLCVHLGVPMNIEDTLGGDIVTSAITHLAHSTPPPFLLASTDLNAQVTVDIAYECARAQNGRIAASSSPGIGVKVNLDVLGPPKFVVENNKQ